LCYAFSPAIYSETNNDGRCPTLLPANHQIEKGIYRVTFETQKYFESQGQACFYPYVQVSFCYRLEKSYDRLPTQKESHVGQRVEKNIYQAGTEREKEAIITTHYTEMAFFYLFIFNSRLDRI
jgi:HIUase/Transthyretin family